ncbi:rab-GTPase-TBC domain-containing protein [Stachybotrys elegans]|uniref:Rab-GTPase-TBC domain-containing protein n=1 Tax=Stachybotrys elegans TaxID=80388 RepID=A0A8K0T5S5_9HYPO|nr:rab-GTPase-TBC domain-containing protein [Stachybotrys elegans]
MEASRASLRIGERSAPETDASHDQKTTDILDACKWKDIARLKGLAASRGGFLTDSLRRSAWPILLGVSSALPHHDSGEWKQLDRHRDEDQVQLDVNRAFIYYPNDQSNAEIDQRKSELSDLIVQVLRRYPYLCYFQGYHDICQVFLLALGPDLSPPVVARLSILRIRDFMLPSLAPTTAQLRLLPDLLAKADPELRRHVAGVEPFYALAGTLTMYAHNIEGYRDISRMFDVFLAREPVFSIYVFAQIVLNRRDEILEVDDLDILHVILSKVPSNLDLDALVASAAALFDRFPPETLWSWRLISSSSALKTARDVEVSAKQTEEQGHEFFLQQVKDIQWAETQDRIRKTVWMYRRPAQAVGMAVAVGLLGLYLRRNPAAVNSFLNAFIR